MLPRGLSEEEFKRLTVKEYLQGGYGVDKQMAEELAQTEWEIRQEVENQFRMKKVVLKEKNDHAGFGKRGIAMHQNRTIKAGNQELRISTTAYKALRKKAILTKEDVEWLFCGMMSFCRSMQRVWTSQSLSPDSEDSEHGLYTNGLINFR